MLPILHMSMSYHGPGYEGINLLDICDARVSLHTLYIDVGISDGSQGLQDFVQIRCGDLRHDGTYLYRKPLSLCSTYHERHNSAPKRGAQAPMSFSAWALS